MAKTYKQLAALQLEIDTLQQKKAEIESALAEARGRFYATEREINKNEKPTPAMMGALTVLHQGGHIARARWDYTYHLIDVAGHTTRLRDSMFYGLKSREAVELGEGDVDAKTYHITEHGRDLLAKHSTGPARDRGDANDTPIARTLT